MEKKNYIIKYENDKAGEVAKKEEESIDTELSTLMKEKLDPQSFRLAKAEADKIAEAKAIEQGLLPPKRKAGRPCKVVSQANRIAGERLEKIVTAILKGEEPVFDAVNRDLVMLGLLQEIASPTASMKDKIQAWTVIAKLKNFIKLGGVKIDQAMIGDVHITKKSISAKDIPKNEFNIIRNKNVISETIDE